MTAPDQNAPPVGYSVVVPVYNSTKSVVELVDRLDAVFRQRVHETYEIILVDDGSPDPETWPTLERLAATHAPVRALQLTRNFGKAGAVLCGFSEARGRYVVTLDDDLQQLPEDLPLLIAERAHDVVIGNPATRQGSLGTRLGSRVKSWFDHRLLGKPNEVRIGPYKLFKAEIVKSMIEVRTPYPFIPALIYYVTRDVVNVPVQHAGRSRGRSGFTLAKRIRQFMALLINNSSFLLQIVAILGVLMSLVSMGLGGFVIAKKLLHGVNVAGWTSLAVIVLMSSGLILFSLGVIGEYLIRIINGIEAHRPYVVRKRAGGDQEAGWDRKPRA